jgi:hypothetical protein
VRTGGSIPASLSENSGIIFDGEPEWRPARLTLPEAEALAAAPNPSGRPNNDVLREFVSYAGHRLQKRWQIDFPAHFLLEEAALYERPCAHLKEKSSGGASWWLNPSANAELRRALARLDRFLVTSASRRTPHWLWVEAGSLPDSSLLAVARDDDFTFAVLSSSIFAAWRQAHSLQPLSAVGASFPFPWPPGQPVGSLNRLQQEHWQETARAARAGDSAQIDFTVAAAYGWPANLNADELLLRLRELHARRQS